MQEGEHYRFEDYRKLWKSDFGLDFYRKKLIYKGSDLEL